MLIPLVIPKFFSKIIPKSKPAAMTVRKSNIEKLNVPIDPAVDWRTYGFVEVEKLVESNQLLGV
jgi:hypothetical protein